MHSIKKFLHQWTVTLPVQLVNKGEKETIKNEACGEHEIRSGEGMEKQHVASSSSRACGYHETRSREGIEKKHVASSSSGMSKEGHNQIGGNKERDTRQ